VPGDAPESQAEAQHTRDLRAAYLACGEDLARLSTLAGRARGAGPPGTGEPPWLDPAGIPADLPSPTGWAALRSLLAGFAAGDQPWLAVLQVRLGGLALDLLDIDPLGVPRQVRPQCRWAWRELDRALPADPVRRLFHLAGGVGVDAGIDPYEIYQALITALPDLGLPVGTALVLVEPDARWRVPHQVAQAATAWYEPQVVLPPAGAVAAAGAEADDPYAVPAAVRRMVPLRYGYDLVLAAIADDGTTRPAPVPLFPAGAAADIDGEIAVEVDLWIPPTVDSAMVLPIVARHGDTPDQWPLIRLPAVDLPPGEHARVRVALQGPGQVRVDGVAGLTDDQRRWSDLLDTLGGTAAIPRADLACVVEISGGPSADERIDLARALVGTLAARCWQPGRLRVVPVGYRQHTWDRRRPDQDHTVWCERFGSPAEAAESLRSWRGEPSRDDLAAAVEDALQTLDGLPWRPNTQRVLLFVGSRSPCPPRQERDHALPCPRRLDWRAGIAGLAVDAHTRMLAVWQPPDWWRRIRAGSPTVLRTQQAWGALGRDGCFILGQITVAELLDKAGLVPDGGGPPPFALAGTAAPIPARADT